MSYPYAQTVKHSLNVQNVEKNLAGKQYAVQPIEIDFFLSSIQVCVLDNELCSARNASSK